MPLKLLYADFPAKPEWTITEHHFLFRVCVFIFSAPRLLPLLAIMTFPVMAWPEGISICFGVVNLPIDITVIAIDCPRTAIIDFPVWQWPVQWTAFSPRAPQSFCREETSVKLQSVLYKLSSRGRRSCPKSFYFRFCYATWFDCAGRAEAQMLPGHVQKDEVVQHADLRRGRGQSEANQTVWHCVWKRICAVAFMFQSWPYRMS